MGGEMARTATTAKKAKAPVRPAAKTNGEARTAKTSKVVLLVSTRKGAWLFHGDPARKNWSADGPHFLGQIVNHLVLDPRDGRTLIAAASTGHLGRRFSARPISERPGKRQRARPRLRKPRTGAKAAPSSTPSG